MRAPRGVEIAGGGNACRTTALGLNRNRRSEVVFVIR